MTKRRVIIELNTNAVRHVFDRLVLEHAHRLANSLTATISFVATENVDGSESVSGTGGQRKRF